MSCISIDNMRNRRGRPRYPRLIRSMPNADYFKPRGKPMTELGIVQLTTAELEAMRLVDFEDMEQEEAAEKMGVSRRTLGRELASGRKKVADALLHGKAIEIIEDAGTFEDD